MWRSLSAWGPELRADHPRLILVMARVLDRLRQIHSTHVHRALGPETIEVDESGAVRILPSPFSISLAESKSGLQMLFGDYRYMAPEMMAQGTVSPATDIYALGMVFYEIVAGQLPHPLGPEETMLDFAKRRCFLDPPSLSSFGPVDGRLEAILDRAIKRGAARRFPSASAMLKELVAAFPEAKAT